jgi:hypothetical protein
MTRAALVLGLPLMVVSIMLRTEENATRVAAGACDCMSWASVYYDNKAMCGRGMELYFLSKMGFSASYAATEPITGLPHKMCFDFFKNFLEPACVNVDMIPFPEDSFTGKQWCYVSNDCAELNGGKYATNVEGFSQTAWHNLQEAPWQAWKICDPTEPSTPALSTKLVPEVVKLAEASDVSCSHIMRLAYPSVNVSWSEAMFLWEAINAEYLPERTIEEMVDAVPELTGWGTEAEEVDRRLRAIAKSEQGTVLDTPGHGDQFHVVQGRAVYEVIRVWFGNMAYLGGHFFEEYVVVCVMGCADKEPSFAVDLDTQ